MRYDGLDVAERSNRPAEVFTVANKRIGATSVARACHSMALDDKEWPATHCFLGGTQLRPLLGSAGRFPRTTPL